MLADNIGHSGSRDRGALIILHQTKTSTSKMIAPFMTMCILNSIGHVIRHYDSIASGSDGRQVGIKIAR